MHAQVQGYPLLSSSCLLVASPPPLEDRESQYSISAIVASMCVWSDHLHEKEVTISQFNFPMLNDLKPVLFVKVMEKMFVFHNVNSDGTLFRILD